MNESSHLFVNKYKPLYFADFCIDANIIDMLKMLISIDDLNIIIVGDAATGKTTLLNAIIREYYAGISPVVYESNILHINNLKEQGIVYYRTDVKTFCQTRSNVKNKKRIVVMDDLSLISDQSQQVFRNCIDKYSNNVHFLASCNNLQKVIDSIQSRLSIIKMTPVTPSDLCNIFDTIRYREKIDICEEDVKELVVRLSNGNVTVVINYMEKFKLLGEPITMDLAKTLCSSINMTMFEEYTRLLLNADYIQSVKIMYELFDNGYSVIDILDGYFAYVNSSTLLTERQKYIIVQCISKYIIIFHTIHEDEIELALFSHNIIKTIN